MKKKEESVCLLCILQFALFTISFIATRFRRVFCERLPSTVSVKGDEACLSNNRAGSLELTSPDPPVPSVALLEFSQSSYER